MPRAAGVTEPEVKRVSYLDQQFPEGSQTQ